MSGTGLFCRNAVTFARDGSIDEDAFRQFLQRFIDARIGLYLNSSGSGEANALTHEEMGRVYRIGVETCKGKIPVYGNPPERPTVRETLENIQLAIDCGVEVVNVYGPPGWHAFRPTDQEYLAFFDELLPSVKHPVALAPNPTLGYSPKPSLIVELCRRYPQVVLVNLVNQGDDYFIELKDSLTRDVRLYVPLTGSLNALLLGANGLVGGEPNILTRTYREYIDHYDAGRFHEAGQAYGHLKRFERYVWKWRGAHPRWIKMTLKVLKMPGGEGGLRSPYRMPDEAELQNFTDGLLRLRIPEITELARAAGLALPA